MNDLHDIGLGPGQPSYSARWGYRDAEVVARYHRRRYGGVGGRLRRFFVGRAVRRALAAHGAGSGYVVDVPSGSGVASQALRNTGVRPVGVDISMSMVRLARRETGRQSRGGWVCGDIERLPFRDDIASGVICLRFFTHLPEERWTSVLGVLGRLTAGPVVIGLPMRRSSKHRWRALKRSFGIDAKRRPIYRLDVVSNALNLAGLSLLGRVWQSPFTDTALVIARRAPQQAPLLRANG